MAGSRTVVQQIEVVMIAEYFPRAHPFRMGWWEHPKSLARRHISQGARVMSVDVSASVGRSKNQNKTLH